MKKKLIYKKKKIAKAFIAKLLFACKGKYRYENVNSNMGRNPFSIDLVEE